MKQCFNGNYVLAIDTIQLTKHDVDTLVPKKHEVDTWRIAQLVEKSVENRKERAHTNKIV